MGLSHTGLYTGMRFSVHSGQNGTESTTLLVSTMALEYERLWYVLWNMFYPP
jgi:hypothetical protein